MVATAKTPRADAALYWKVYALDKLGQKAEALATAEALSMRTTAPMALRFDFVPARRAFHQ